MSCWGPWMGVSWDILRRLCGVSVEWPGVRGARGGLGPGPRAAGAEAARVVGPTAPGVTGPGGQGGG